MTTIHLPAGKAHVKFGEIPKLITDVLNPNDGTDLSAIRYVAACNELKRALRRAVDDGDLSVMSPFNPMVPHEFPFGDALNNALVPVADLRQFVSLAGMTVIVDAPEPPTAQEKDAAKPAPVADGEWITQAQARAREIIKESKEHGRYPSQVDISDRIAAEFRKSEIFGSDGKPLAGAYIKRHALKGISSAKGKQLSTTIGRGK